MKRLLKALGVAGVSLHACLAFIASLDYLVRPPTREGLTVLRMLYNVFIAPTGLLTLMALTALAVLGGIALQSSRLRLESAPLELRTALVVGLGPGLLFATLWALSILGLVEDRSSWIDVTWPIAIFGPALVFVARVVWVRLRADSARLRPASASGSSSPLRLLFGSMVGLFAVVMILGLCITLLHMTQLRGWVPGRVVTIKPITQLWHEEQNGRSRDTYWVSWDTTDIRRKTSDRLKVDAAVWNGLAVGDSFPVISVPGGSRRFTTNDTFASYGSFGFDLTLLALMLLAVRWSYRQFRPPAPVTATDTVDQHQSISQP